MNMSASVLADCPVAVKSRSFIQRSSTSDTSERCHPPPEKNIRRSADITSTFTLLTDTDLNALFTSSCVTYPIILHYCTPTSARVSHHCGQISVDIKDLQSGKMSPRLLQDTKVNTGQQVHNCIEKTFVTVHQDNVCWFKLVLGWLDLVHTSDIECLFCVQKNPEMIFSVWGPWWTRGVFSSIAVITRWLMFRVGCGMSCTLIVWRRSQTTPHPLLLYCSFIGCRKHPSRGS